VQGFRVKFTQATNRRATIPASKGQKCANRPVVSPMDKGLLPANSACFRPSTWITIGVWLSLAACLYSIAADYHYQWDFHVYYTAAREFAAGRAPYLHVYPHPWDRTLVFLYNYSPLTLYAFQWTVPLSLEVAKWLWLGLKLVGLACLLRLWHTSFERLNAGWAVVLFLALGFNSALLRDFTAGNMSTLEQLGIWLGFGLLIHGRLYAAALVLACVAQFKFLPIAFLPLLLANQPRDGWKPFVVGCVTFVAVFALNLLMGARLFHDYIVHFADPLNEFDSRGVNNPSSLAFFRDLIDATSYTNGLPENVSAGTRIYVVYLILVALLLVKAVWKRRDKLRAADPKLLVYFACALFTIVSPRLKDYSYILMLIPALFVVRELGRRGLRPDYLLLGIGLMTFGQPQQSLVPGLEVLIYMLQAYLPLFLSAAVMVYVLKMILTEQRTASVAVPPPAIRSISSPRARQRGREMAPRMPS
jgi:Glycosyltransferase family 87